MGILQRVGSAIKKWVGGGSRRSTPPAPRGRRYTNNRYTSARPTYQGGRFRASYEEDERKKKEQKEKQVKDSFKAKKQETKDMPEAFNRGKSLAEAVIKKAEQNSVIERKAQLDANRERLKKRSGANSQNETTFTNARGDEVHVYSHRGSRGRTLVGGTNASNMKYRMEVMPKSTSFARGAASGLSLGASELAAKNLAKNNEDRANAEEAYQSKKNKWAEMGGEAVGSLVTFGGTEGATRALATKAFGKTSAKAARKFASKKLIQNTAKRSVEKAVKKGVVNSASEELIKQVGRDKAKRIVENVGADIMQNATTGLVYDFNKASAEHKIGSTDWWKEMGKSAAFNAAITSGVAGVSAKVGGKGLVKESAGKIADRAAARYLLNPKGKRDAIEEADDIVSNAVRLPRKRKAITGVGYIDVEKERAALKKTAEDLRARADALEKTVKNEKQAQEVARLRYKAEKIERSLERNADEPAKKVERKVPSYTKYGNQDDDWVTTIKKAADEGLSPEERAKLVERNADDATPKGEVFAKDKNGWSWGKTEDGKLYVGDDYDKAFFEDTPENREKVAKYWENRAVSKGKANTQKVAETDASAGSTSATANEAVKTEPPTRKPTKTEKARDELRAERQAMQERYEAAQAAGEDTTELLDDMAEADLMLKDFDAKIARADKARETRAANKARLSAKNEVENASAEITEETVKNTPPEAKITDEAVKNTPPEAKQNGAEQSSSGRQTKAKKQPRVINKTEDMVGGKRQKPSLRERINEFTSSIRTKVADSLSAFEDEARKKARTDHEGMLKDYGAINALRSYKTRANRSVTNHQLKWDGTRFENGKSIAEIFGGMTEEEEKAFNAYLLLKHAPDRLREGKSVFEGVKLSDGRALDDPEFVKRLKRNRATVDDLKKQIERAETEEEAAAVQKKLDKLIAEMKQDADDTIARMSEVWDSEIERLMRENPNVNFEERAQDVYQYTRNELQNRVDAGLLKQSVADDWNKRHPFYVPTGREGYFNGVHGDYGATTGADGIYGAKGSDYDIWDIKQQLSDATTRNWRDMSMNNLFARMFGDKVANDLAGEVDGGLETVLDNTITLSKSRERDRYFANVFFGGEEERVEIDKRFYDAIQDMYKNGRLGNGIDTVNDAFAGVAQTWKNLITEWSPIFMIKNFMRDFPEAVINTRQTKEFLESMRPALTELKDGGEYYQSLLDSGISMSTFVDIEKALAKDKRGIMGLIEKGNEMAEMLPRLCEYMATFKKAGVELKNGQLVRIADGSALDVVEAKELRDMAAANAADVTVNFGRSGSFGKMLNRGFVPFFNPSVQGWSKFIRNVSELEGVKDTLGFFAKATALGAAPLTLNNFCQKDNPNYQMISARDKATNYIIAIPPFSTDTNVFIKIPRSRFAAVYGLPVANAFNENKMGFAEAIKIIDDQVTPIDPLESTLFSPFIAARRNESWYGTPIVSGALEDLPKSEQYDANTSWLAKQLGKATQNLPNELQISPKKADYILDAETGVIGDFALPMMTPSRQGNGVVGKTLSPALNVLKRQFSIDSVTQNNLSQRFYDELQKANMNNKSAKGGKEEEAEYKRMSAYSTEVSKLTQAIKDLQGSKRATKQDDIYGLQEAKNKLLQDALDGKDAPTKMQTVNAVQKYVGTSYAINNFGSSADQEAMKLYGLAKYGNLTDSAMAKRIDADKEFYKGVKAIGNLEGKIKKEGIKGATTTLAKSVALASSGADDDLFGAYGATLKSRTETATKMERSRNYIVDGGSEEEFVKLEKARKTLGKLSDLDVTAEEEKLEKQVGSGAITLAEYRQKSNELEYNANISYVGLATSLAQANAPARGYELYDIKPKNVQKGINLAAMGFTARDYRKMAKELDADGNGYPSKKEITAYVAKSDVEDKATLFDALYYYKGSSNPFGKPTNYSRDMAAEVGRSNGIEAISDEKGKLNLKNSDGENSSSGYSGYRRGYRRYHRRGGGGRSKIPAIKQSAFKAKKSSYAFKDLAESLKTRSTASTSTASKVKIEPPKVKFKKYEV